MAGPSAQALCTSGDDSLRALTTGVHSFGEPVPLALHNAGLPEPANPLPEWSHGNDAATDAAKREVR